MDVELIVMLKTYSTSASGICRRLGVGRLRHPHKKELWLQDEIAGSNIELGRVSSEGNEADLRTKYLERDHIKKCVTKMWMLFAGAWAVEQLPVVSGTEAFSKVSYQTPEAFSERKSTPLHLIEGQSWKIGVVLLVTVGAVLLSCACIGCYSHLPTERNVTREPEVARRQSCMRPKSMRAGDIDHVKERTWILSWYYGDQLRQLMMLNTRSFLGSLFSSCGTLPP